MISLPKSQNYFSKKMKSSKVKDMADRYGRANIDFNNLLFVGPRRTSRIIHEAPSYEPYASMTVVDDGMWDDGMRVEEPWRTLHFDADNVNHHDSVPEREDNNKETTLR